jgi:hypothetical protein
MSYTDPDAKVAKKSGKPRMLCYSSIMSVDTQHHIITHMSAEKAHRQDSRYLIKTTKQVKHRLENLGLRVHNILADAGFSSGENNHTLNSININAFIPLHGTYKPKLEGFDYDPISDTYTCSQGQKLEYRQTAKSGGYYKKRYLFKKKQCDKCPELLDFDQRLENRAKSLHAVESYSQYLQEFINDKLKEVDTIQLRKSIYYTGYLLVINKSNSAYQNLVNEGDIKHIRNGELKKALAVFYNKDDWRSYFHDNVILKGYQEYLRYIHKFTAPGSIRTLYEAEMPNVRNDLSLSGEAIDRLSNPNGSMIDWDKLKDDLVLKEIIDHVLTVRYLQIRQYNYENRNDIAQIIPMIEKELGNER